jgi:hypothetical protein
LEEDVRRLEYPRRIRTARGRARNEADALLQRLQVTFERQRLEQERIALVRRVRRIEARLVAIGAARALEQSAASAAPGLAPGACEVTLQY